MTKKIVYGVTIVCFVLSIFFERPDMPELKKYFNYMTYFFLTAIVAATIYYRKSIEKIESLISTSKNDSVDEEAYCKANDILKVYLSKYMLSFAVFLMVATILDGTNYGIAFSLFGTVYALSSIVSKLWIIFIFILICEQIDHSYRLASKNI